MRSIIPRGLQQRALHGNVGKGTRSNVKRDRNSVGVLDTLTGARVPAANKSIMGKISVSGLGRTVSFECLPCECTGIATCNELVAKTLLN